MDISKALSFSMQLVVYGIICFTAYYIACKYIKSVYGVIAVLAVPSLLLMFTMVNKEVFFNKGKVSEENTRVSTFLRADEIKNFTVEAEIIDILMDKCVGSDLKEYSFSYTTEYESGETLRPLQVVNDTENNVTALIWTGEDEATYEVYGVKDSAMWYKDGVLQTGGITVQVPEVNDMLYKPFDSMITACSWKIDGYDGYDFTVEKSDNGTSIIKRSGTIEITIKLDKANYPLEVVAKNRDKEFRSYNYKVEARDITTYPYVVRRSIAEVSGINGIRDTDIDKIATPDSMSVNTVK